MSTLWEPNGTRKISHSTKSYDANEFAKSEQRKKRYKKKKKFTCATGDIKAHGLLVGPKGLKE